ncbi:hypothetical protein NQ315_000063 [Exocentrus adspersus]|uniref:Ras-related protein Rab-36 n=1 Tax=Exocentrus adspersus TaxID=1586481 RepID=A0AAV8VU03_9CUCU|nr:hypothetical protein NQ315_000063 [Exocentrus adspersus]
MPQVRSNVMKMLNDEVPEDRKITTFQGPYKMECTPYQQLDFTEMTYRKCSEEKINWLKLSKMIIIGDVSVGKTSIVNRFCRKIFDSNYKSTIGVDFEVEKFCILDVPFCLQIWDTAGQERFKSIAQSYYRGAQVILLAFDFTNIKSLCNCRTWLNEALGVSSSLCPFIFLVGTKLDLMSKTIRQNMEKNIMKAAQQLNAEYWAISSKTGKNIDKLFCRIASLCFDNSIRNEFQVKKQIIIGTNLLSSNENANQNFVRKCEGFKCSK